MDPQPIPPLDPPPPLSAQQLLKSADARQTPYVRALLNLKVAIGNAWDERLSEDERALATAITTDIVDLFGETASWGTDTGPEALQILAQLANLKSIEADRLKHYILVAAGRALMDGAGWLVTAAAPYLEGGLVAALI